MEESSWSNYTSWWTMFYFGMDFVNGWKHSGKSVTLNLSIQKLILIKMKILQVIILFAILVSCKNNKPSSGTMDGEESRKTDSVTEVKEEVENPSNGNLKDTNLCRLMISFYSIGEGSDYKLIKELEDTITSYAAQTGKNIDFVKSSWGREGENDFSFKLNELSKEEQSDFVKRVREILKKGKLVSIYENHPCSTRGRKK